MWYNSHRALSVVGMRRKGRGWRMANQPDPSNILRGIRVPRDLDAKVLKRYRMKGDTVKDAYIRAVERATHGTVLTAEERRRVDEDTREAARIIREAVERERGGAPRM